MFYLPKYFKYKRITGAVYNSESNLSKIPPCPGITEDESFTPASLLKRDSIKSPICPNSPIIIPIAIAVPNDKKLSIIILAKTMVITAKTNPKPAPSQVLFGLTLANSLCFPSAVPP